MKKRTPIFWHTGRMTLDWFGLMVPRTRIKKVHLIRTPYGYRFGDLTIIREVPKPGKGVKRAGVARWHVKRGDQELDTKWKLDEVKKFLSRCQSKGE